MSPIKETEKGLIMNIYVQPRSSKNMITGIHGDAIKVKITAPPKEGAANAMCLKFLSKCLKIPKSSMEIISGKSSRTKKILIRRMANRVSGKEIDRIKKTIKELVA